jgi:hypothetical protein
MCAHRNVACGRGKRKGKRRTEGLIARGERGGGKKKKERKERKEKKGMFEIVVRLGEVLQGVKVATYYVGEARKDAAGGTAARVMAATRFQASDDDDGLLEEYADAGAWEMAGCLPNTVLVKECEGRGQAPPLHRGAPGEVVYRYRVGAPAMFHSQWAEAVGQGVKRGVGLYVLYRWYAHRDEGTAQGYREEYEGVRARVLYDVARRQP